MTITRDEALDMAIAALDDPEAIAWLESTRDGLCLDARWIRDVVDGELDVSDLSDEELNSTMLRMPDARFWDEADILALAVAERAIRLHGEAVLD